MSPDTEAHDTTPAHRDLHHLLGGYDPTRLMILTREGHWSGTLETLRDRIVNEVIHTLWTALHDTPDPEGVEQMLAPVMGLSEPAPVPAWNGDREAGEGMNRAAILGRFNLLCDLIEYEVNLCNARQPVAQWDRRARERQEAYRLRSRELAAELRRITGPDTLPRELVGSLKTLRLNSRFFGQVVRVCCGEEQARVSVTQMTPGTETRQAGAGTETAGGEEETAWDTVLSAEDYTSLINAHHEPAVLLRTCLQLLDDPAIDITTGAPYAAVSLLGSICDSRSLRPLLTLLENCEPKHTNLRANLIYALGSQRRADVLPALVSILESPDAVEVQPRSGDPPFRQSRSAEKQEAIWAIGKQTEPAVEAIPALTRYVDASRSVTRAALAWALGQIGTRQKARDGGIDAALVIALMQLLLDTDIRVFEQAATGLRALGLPDFVHTLYLHKAETIPILSLHPARNGIYEISETILHLVERGRTVVMAVTGDSGTGKTYFCDCLRQGFAEVGAEEILYLQRDRPTHMQIFNRILGLDWLRTHVDPRYYEEYPPGAEGEDPADFLDEFVQRHESKRLMILDGWRDEAYFEQVIQRFYEAGCLDLIVHFRTDVSTRRLNLEEREKQLDRVQSCLDCVESPSANIAYHREGKVLVYNLDNSIPARLSADEIIEVFGRRKVTGWESRIKVGEFTGRSDPIIIQQGVCPISAAGVRSGEGAIEWETAAEFQPREMSFARKLNGDLTAAPCLLQQITLDDLSPRRLAYFAPGQIAFCGTDGTVGILSGSNDHCLYTRLERSDPTDLVVLGDDIVARDSEGALHRVSMRDGTAGACDRRLPFVTAIAAAGGIMMTGHRDGSLRRWNSAAGSVRTVQTHSAVITAVGIDRRGNLYAGDQLGRLQIWRADGEEMITLGALPDPIRVLDILPDGTVAAGLHSGEGNSSRTARIVLLDPASGEYRLIGTDHPGQVNRIRAYADNRLFLTLGSGHASDFSPVVAVLDLRPSPPQFEVIGRYVREAYDCLIMGPRLITCGTDEPPLSTLKIWGSPPYVASEVHMLDLLPASGQKPPHYRTLF